METTLREKLTKDFLVFYKGIILVAAPIVFLPAALIGQTPVSMSYNRQVKLHELCKCTHLNESIYDENNGPRNDL